MAKGNILKEAIADAKAVREVALQNAKTALEEAFTPKLQNMLSTKLAEDLDEEMYYDEDDKELDLGEMGGMHYDEDDTNERMYDEDETDSMDEEIDLEEILNELELDESKDADDEKVVSEKKSDDDEEVDLDEIMKPHYTADDVNKVNPSADPNNIGYVHEEEEFDLDSLLKEINEIEDLKPAKEVVRPVKIKSKHSLKQKQAQSLKQAALQEINSSCKESKVELTKIKEELNETKKALNTVKGELNEVNLLNSKLLYVNRIFKANTLDDAQKLRVVETLDKADSTKEAKLIYETIKDSFSIAKTKKVVKKQTRKPMKESFKGMASKSTGISRTKKVAPKKAIISESDNMVNRFQKLANIKINE